MTLESIPGDARIVATGASGFGIAALIVGVDRGFITRQQGLDRLTKIVHFLDHADRYHGIWSHFMNGSTGKTMPVFGMFDDLPAKYDWALPLLEYNTAETLLASFDAKVVAPALDKLEEIRRRKALPPARRSAEG